MQKITFGPDRSKGAADSAGTAMHWLARDPLFHVDMIEVLRRRMADVVAAGQRGVLLRLIEDPGVYLHSASTAKEAARLAALVEGAELLVAHQEDFLDDIYQNTNLTLMMTCYQAICPESGPTDTPVPGLEIHPLGPEWADFISGVYKNPVGIEYLAHILEAGLVYGGFVEGELSGFVGEHGEGSLGMLEVLPAYRRRGIGAALMAHAARAQLAKGWRPFAQVTVGNEASRRLHSSIGFRLTDRRIYWLEGPGLSAESQKSNGTFS